MKSSRNQLILIGLISQGFSWDTLLLPLAYALGWFVCVLLPPGRFALRHQVEGAMLILGCAAALVFGSAFSQNAHFFLGHGLAFVQLARLLRPLTAREKLFSILIACFHIAVGCTILLDLRFLLIFIAAVLLVPRSLAELQWESFSASLNPVEWAVISLKKVSYATCLLIGGVAILFFFAFPRVFIGSGLQLRPAPDQGTFLDTILDPTRSGMAQSDRTLMQIEGEKIGYLRCYALSQFDGVQWTQDQRPALKRIRFAAPENLEKFRYRRARVKNPLYLERILPTDGRVVNLRGKFFRRPFLNMHDSIECEAMWNTSNNLYEYWIDPNPAPEALLPMQSRICTNYPPQSARLRSWVNDLLQDVTDPLEQARLLEAHLRVNFAYNLGAPALNRLNHVDDFIFNQRQGHCERFASTLALLLRMKSIPSRVVIGYLPNTRNRFSGWYNIRFKDAHSWTEGYFAGKGWVQFDATPQAAAGSATSVGWGFRELYESLDYYWSSEIANFDGASQQYLATAGLRAVARGATFLQNHKAVVVGVFAVAIVLLGLFRLRFDWRLILRGKAQARAIVVAEYYYGEFLKLLARKGIAKTPTQTPWEFLETLRSQQFPGIGPAEEITRHFCRVRYGNMLMDPTTRAELKNALRSLEA